METSRPEETTVLKDWGIDLINELNNINAIDKVNSDDFISPSMFGAIGDGVSDDTAAFSRALDEWLGRDFPGVFKLGAGKNYKINTVISKTISATEIGPWIIDGYGAKITSGVASGTLLTFVLSGTPTVRNLIIKGLNIYGANTESLLTLNGGDSATGYFYGSVIRDCIFENFAGNGLSLLGNFFESTVDTCQFRSNAANVTGYGLYCYDGTGSGIVSSINVNNCIASYGKNGIYVKSPTGDVKVYGCSAFYGYEYGILLENNFGNSITNCHLENNWESAADLANGKAGLSVINSGRIEGCYGTTNSKQRYVVEAYASAGEQITISSGRKTGSVVKYAYVNGDAGSNIYIEGGQTYDTVSDSPNCSIARTGFGYKNLEPVSTSGAGEDNLMSYTLPQYVLGVKGVIRVTAFGVKTNGNSENKTIKFYFGSTPVTFHAAAANSNDWRLEAIITNYRDDTNQSISWVGYDGATVLQGLDGATEDTTGGDITIKLTGECASGTDTITQSAMVVEFL